MLTIQRISTTGAELNIVKTLFREYSDALNENLCFQSFEEELDNPLKKYGEPEGCILLAYWNDTPAGCIALQPLQESGVCEMKRLFVRNEFRYKGIGDQLIHQLVSMAEKKSYRKMVLDTLERLSDAQKLYIKHGFATTPAYYPNPLSKVVYMEKKLIVSNC